MTQRKRDKSKNVPSAGSQHKTGHPPAQSNTAKTEHQKDNHSEHGGFLRGSRLPPHQPKPMQITGPAKKRRFFPA